MLISYVKIMCWNIVMFFIKMRNILKNEKSCWAFPSELNTCLVELFLHQHYANTRSLIIHTVCSLVTLPAIICQSYVLLSDYRIFSCNISFFLLKWMSKNPHESSLKTYHQLLTHTIYYPCFLNSEKSFHFCLSGRVCVSSPWPLASFCSLNANISALFF